MSDFLEVDALQFRNNESHFYRQVTLNSAPLLPLARLPASARSDSTAAAWRRAMTLAVNALLELR